MQAKYCQLIMKTVHTNFQKDIKLLPFPSPQIHSILACLHVIRSRILKRSVILYGIKIMTQILVRYYSLTLEAYQRSILHVISPVYKVWPLRPSFQY